MSGKTNYNTSTYSVTGNSQDLSDIFAPLASPTFTGTVSGITKTMVGLDQVDNTSDANKPVSTATSTQLNFKAPLASPTFTGTVTCADIICNNLNANGSNPINIATDTTASALTIGNSAVPTTIYGSSVNIMYSGNKIPFISGPPVYMQAAKNEQYYPAVNGTFPMFCSIYNYAEYNDCDSYYYIMPGFSMVIYESGGYQGQTYALDNSTGTVLKKFSAQYTNWGGSCKLYYGPPPPNSSGVEITITGISDNI